MAREYNLVVSKNIHSTCSDNFLWINILLFVDHQTLTIPQLGSNYYIYVCAFLSIISICKVFPESNETERFWVHHVIISKFKVNLSFDMTVMIRLLRVAFIFTCCLTYFLFIIIRTTNEWWCTHPCWDNFKKSILKVNIEF